MVDQRLALHVRTLALDCSELLHDLLLDFIVVCYFISGDAIRLNIQSEVHNVFNFVNHGLVALLSLKLELNRDVTSVDSHLQALYMTADVGFSINKLAFVELLVVLLLLVREDNVSSEGLSHKEIFTESTRTSSQHFIRVSGDNSAQSEDEVVDHLHVQEVGGYRVRDRVFSQVLGMVPSVGHHQLRVQLYGIVAQLCFGDSL
jgi:hypothetical protein